mmetsp:Transcript_16304/g.61844  ORF Transcript_16304/g.61844 Transcript_16304/m.61844 type:complete len:284 (-) Transcript_16304:436-1287(-)
MRRPMLRTRATMRMRSPRMMGRLIAAEMSTVTPGLRQSRASCASVVTSSTSVSTQPPCMAPNTLQCSPSTSISASTSTNRSRGSGAPLPTAASSAASTLATTRRVAAASLPAAAAATTAASRAACLESDTRVMRSALATEWSNVRHATAERSTPVIIEAAPRCSAACRRSRDRARPSPTEGLSPRSRSAAGPSSPGAASGPTRGLPAISPPRGSSAAAPLPPVAPAAAAGARDRLPRNWHCRMVPIAALAALLASGSHTIGAWSKMGHALAARAASTPPPGAP